VISVALAVPPQLSELLIRSPEVERLTSIKSIPKARDIDLKKILPHPYSSIQFTKIKENQNSAFTESMLQLESKIHKKDYRIGVLYVKGGQKEKEWWSNNGGDKSYEEFLDFLGKVPSKKETIVQSIEGKEVVFSVATMITDDSAKIERKRHVSSTTVLLIFLDEEQQCFDPDWLHNKLTSVYVIITEDKILKQETGRTYYRVAVALRNEVKPVTPFLPKPAFFKKCPDFKKFLLTKLINAARGTLATEKFKDKFQETKKQLILQEIQECKKSV